ncbi:MAG: signal peptidase I [Anaerolineae bacterium]|jgi:signal peptidase I|nr:signal peptidase I [Anaerolineae bacterium]
MMTTQAERSLAQPLTTDHTLLPKPRLRRPGFWRELLNSAFFILAALILSELAFPRSSITGPSMEPSMFTGHQLLINRVAYLLADPRPGEIAVFDAPDAKEELLIKRVIGVPGDTIEIRVIRTTDATGVEVRAGAEVYRNGQLLDEPYFVNRPCNNCQDNVWVLGEDEYFFMGDNRNESNDSRRFGAVKREAIVGRAIFRYFPLDLFGTLN